jgi:hypothetical protein
MNKLSFDSTSSVKGIIFQFLIALEKCFEMQEGQSVYIERFGDVSLVGKEESVQVESKYYKRSLTDLDKNVWNTLANWMDCSFPLEKFSALVLLTTQKVGVRSKWNNWNSKNITERKTILNDIYRSFEKKRDKSEDLQRSMSKVFNIEQTSRLEEIAKKLAIDHLVTDGSSYYEKLRDIYGRHLPKIQRSRYINALYGYIITPHIIENNWQISYDDFGREQEVLSEKLQNNTAIFPKKKNLGEINVNEYLSNTFVSKIQDIEYYDVIPEAVSDYVHAGRLIVEDIEISPTIKAEYDTYEEELERIYKSKYRKACRNCNAGEVIIKSKDLYDNITGSNDGTFHVYNRVPLFFHNGVMHILADEKAEIIWKLKVESNE